MSIAGLIRSAVGSPISRMLPKPVKALVWNLLNLRSEFTMYGSRMVLPDALRHSYEFRTVTYQEGLVRCLQDLITPGMTFVDVGANVGVITTLAARLVGPTGKVFAFEPVPANAAYLRKNVALNDYRNVIIKEAAISDSEGRVDLHLSDQSGQHSMFELHQFDTGRVHTVDAIRLDSLPELASIDVLKIDVEGAELKVLKGLGALRPTHIFVECNEDRLRVAGSSGQELRDTLMRMGYQHFDAIDGTRNKDDWHVHGLAAKADAFQPAV